MKFNKMDNHTKAQLKHNAKTKIKILILQYINNQILYIILQKTHCYSDCKMAASFFVNSFLSPCCIVFGFECMIVFVSQTASVEKVFFLTT